MSTRNPTNDLAIAFGAVLTLLTVWSFIEAGRSKHKPNAQIQAVHTKLDLILSKLK